MWIGDIVKMAANARPKNELVYNPSTWAEWTKSNVVGNATGLEFTCVDGAYTITNLATGFKTSTKYGVLLNVVSNSLNLKSIYVDNSVATSLLYIVTSATTVGNQKFTFTSKATIVSNFFNIQTNNSVGGNGTKAKIKDIRVFELPAGSAIEADFAGFTADQLNNKYPF